MSLLCYQCCRTYKRYSKVQKVWYFSDSYPLSINEYERVRVKIIFLLYRFTKLTDVKVL